ncbi:MAG: hypothetical protein U1A27_02095 [Phycisphaerae bacterium]
MQGRARPAMMLALLWATGCASHPDRSQPRLAVVDDLPTARELGVAESAIPKRGFAVIEQGASFGRFPTGLAVAKVAAREPAGGRRRLELLEVNRKDAARWNHLLNLQPLVRAALVMGPYGLPRGSVVLDDVLGQATTLGCELCLVYAEGGNPDTDTELMGVLFEAAARRPLAVFHALSQMTRDEIETCQHDNPLDYRSCCAEFAASRDLEESVVAAMWQLSRADRPVNTTQPNPWQSYRPHDTVPPLLRGREIIIRP